MSTPNTDGALSVAVKNGNTTVTTIGRAQTDVVLNPDGSLNITVFPNVQRFDVEGEPIGSATLNTQDAFTAILPVEVVLAFLAAVRAAWDAKSAPVTVVAPVVAPVETPAPEPVVAPEPAADPVIITPSDTP